MINSQVFQTFQCEDLNEIDKRYLRADLRIECDTAEYKAYELYAGFMVILCEFIILSPCVCLVYAFIVMVIFLFIRSKKWKCQRVGLVYRKN